LADSLISGISNSNLAGGVSSLFSAGTSLFSGFATAQADEAQAQAFDIAAQFAVVNEHLAGEAGGLKELQSARQQEQVQGKQMATAAGNGMKIGGSALSIVRDASQQGALDRGVLGLQTSINVTNYAGQAAAAQAQAAASRQAASAAQTGGILGAAGGIIGGIAKLFL
jgi:hypothetical protein